MSNGADNKVGKLQGDITAAFVKLGGTHAQLDQIFEWLDDLCYACHDNGKREAEADLARVTAERDEARAELATRGRCMNCGDLIGGRYCQECAG